MVSRGRENLRVADEQIIRDLTYWAHKNMNKEPNFDLNNDLEKSVLIKVQELLRVAGISDYTHEEQADGTHFRIKTTPEHIKDRRKQMATLGGGLEPTQFMKDRISPLKKLLLQERGLKFNFVGGLTPQAGYLEIVISKAE